MRSSILAFTDHDMETAISSFTYMVSSSITAPASALCLTMKTANPLIYPSITR